MKNIFFIITILLVSSCNAAPTEGIIQTAIAQTQAAMPVATDIPAVEPTQEPTDIPTEVPQPTELPIVDDSHLVIDMNPRDMLLEKNDTPYEGAYYIPGGDWNSPLRNLEVIAGVGVDYGKVYLAETQRIDGWKIGFERGSKTVIAPEEIQNSVSLHETMEGAYTHFTDYGICLDRSKGYRQIETDYEIGNYSSVCMDTLIHESGDRRVTLLIEFVHRNLFVTISIWGWEDEVTPEYLFDVTEILFAKLSEFELSESVFFLP